MDTPRNLAVAVLALLLAGCASSGQPSATDVMVEFEAQNSSAYRPRVTARWPTRRPKLSPTQLLVVRLPGQSPLLGAFETTDNTVTFIPRFPLLANQRYEAAVLPDGPKVSHTTPAPTGSAPRIIAIHPTTDALPANHLKFYIVFSEPMQPGEIWNYFQLLDLGNNRPVPRPFRHSELWTRDGKTLTLAGVGSVR